MAATTQLASSLYLLPGAVNTGVLVAEGAALLFDCCETVSIDRLAPLGVERVDSILCTQHRRVNVVGAYPFLQEGGRLVAPAGECELFEAVDAYWDDPGNRWHIYHHQPGPQVLACPLPVSQAVSEGDVIEWSGFEIAVLDTPGATDGSVSYLVTVDGHTFCFCGDVLYGPGKVWQLYALQKGHGDVLDYHGFLGNRRKLIPSLKKLGECGTDVLIPAHGKVIDDPAAATDETLARLEAAWHNYTSISALNYYFPGFLEEAGALPEQMMPAKTLDPPSFVRRCGDGTSFALISDSGAALLIDCGSPKVLDVLARWLAEGSIRSIDACWITHYHDDHVDALPALRETHGCSIVTDVHVSEIIEHPRRFFLPCISPASVPIAWSSQEGEIWHWEEYALTPYHFPGQSLYHSGLLVEGHGLRLFFAGDSGAPTGLDDYCAANRNFLGPHRGYRRCIEIWRQTDPHMIFNQHQARPFTFTTAQLDTMEGRLIERERLFAALLPWSHPDFGTDENWVRAYPYEQDTAPGGTVEIDIRLTNHGYEARQAILRPVLPPGWQWDVERSKDRLVVPPRTSGTVCTCCPNPDGVAQFLIQVPEAAAPSRTVIPFSLEWGGDLLGQLRHAIVNVVESSLHIHEGVEDKGSETMR